MGADQTDLTGPDLTRGVPIAELREGTMMVGHAHGESVLLARRGDELFAIGATCSHYSGPLGEGLLVGDTVRCPWHHACFSLRTGEALRAPALHPVSCWRVERRRDSVYVTGKKEAVETEPDRLPDATASPETAIPSAIVIVGGGAAGDAAAEMLRREGFGGRITVISSDETSPYDRPNLSKDYLAGTAPEEWLPLRAPNFYDEHEIEFVLRTTVTAIDPGAKRVHLDSGDQHRFDRLLLATGAAPVRLPVPGAGHSHVHYLRTVGDCRAIIGEDDAHARRAVVIGASFIGMEVAASLRTRGIEVHVVAPEARPMERVFGTALGAMIQDLHESHGVAFHLEMTVTSIGSDSVTLSTGDELPADMVVIGIGVRAATSLAEAAGLPVDNGVIVDQYLRTSHADIFAAGDVARWPYRGSGPPTRVEHWVVAQRQGQVAARNMLGRREPFDAVPFFWSQHYDVPITYVGHAPGWDRVDVAGSIEDHNCLVAYRRDGETLAVAGIHRDLGMLEAEAAMERLDEEALKQLVPPSGGKGAH